MGMNPKEFVSRSIDIAKNSEVSDPLEHLEPSARVALREINQEAALLFNRAFSVWVNQNRKNREQRIDAREIINVAGFILNRAAILSDAFTIPFDGYLDTIPYYSGDKKVRRLDIAGIHVTDDMLQGISEISATAVALEYAVGVEIDRRMRKGGPSGNIKIIQLLGNLVWHIKETLAMIDSSLEEAVDMSMEIIERQADVKKSGKTTEQVVDDTTEMEEDTD